MAKVPFQYPWYETVEGDGLEQGDILREFDVFVRAAGETPDSNEVHGEMQSFDVIVMTQTCDIAHGKARSLLLCPWFDLWEFVDAAKKSGENWSTEIRESLRRGNLPGYHLLNDVVQDGIELGLCIVDFHEVYTAPTDHLRDFAAKCGKRLRLRPPYREHLGQAFARFFMRIGLPVDIASEKLKRPKS